MKNLGNLALVGSGPTAVYLLNQIARHSREFSKRITSITIFEKASAAGYGMPYHPDTTDIHNLSNICSDEIPALPESLYDWLASRSDEELRCWKINRSELNKEGIYVRLAVGSYLSAQYRTLVRRITDAGIPVTEMCPCEVVDILSGPDETGFVVVTADGSRLPFGSVAIASGHRWSEPDDPGAGYYSSPWPISKILPEDGELINKHIGTLGASLSAFDVVSSLSHRHGTFCEEGENLTYLPSPGTEGFRITMHSADGWLPLLQYEQLSPLREIYRHVSHDRLMDLRDDSGHLRLASYFDSVCRPVLAAALAKDGLNDASTRMRNREYTLAEFVEHMSEGHDYSDPFGGMAKELRDAKQSLRNHRPDHWKEALDDLIYTLNFHAEMMPAEDHLELRSVVMPFLMCVIAAMPLQSARMILALHDAGKLDLVPGYVKIKDRSLSKGATTVEVDHEGEFSEHVYGMFVGCGGQSPMGIDEYPFRGLVESGKACDARAAIISPETCQKLREKGDGSRIIETGSGNFMRTGGVWIDRSYRLIGIDGSPDDMIYELAFPHTSGVRPYSYGLQACSETAEIVSAHWLA